MRVSRTSKLCLIMLVVVAVVGFVAWQPQGAAGADLTSNYTWDFVKIGGWTWFTNIYVHPSGTGPVYNNSDTACPYRWDEANQKWVPIVVVPGESPNALSIVGAPTNASVAYVAHRDNLAGSDLGNVYRSTDQGDTWTLPNGGTLNLFMAPNGTARQSGPRLAVDPADENCVYFGSQEDGLWVTTDGAQNWSQVTDVPVPNNGEGVTCVDFDPNSGTSGGLTNVIYATVSGQGVYQSTDAGASWTDIGGPTTWARAAKVGGDGTYYVADSGGTLNRYSGGSWTNISPGTIYGVAVDPFDANRIVAVNAHSETYISTDQGANWTLMPYTVDYNGIASQAQRAGVDRIKIAFDPAVQDKLWAVEAYGLWQLDVSTGTAAWTCNAHGSEGYATHNIIKPPGGGVVSGCMDGGVYYHPDPATYDSVQVASPSTNNWLYQHGWGSDYCVADPTFVAAINSPPHQWSDELSGYSNSGGQQDTWTLFGTAPLHEPTTPTGIAVSATDANNIVIYDGSQNKAYSTTDCGSSWSAGTSFGQPLMTSWGPGDGALAADRVDGGTFYAYDWADSEIWRTTDGGSSWSAVGSIPGGANYSDISATAGNAGHVWFCFNCVPCGTTGLLRSTDYGATWAYVSGVDSATSICFGKAADGATYPTIFLYGTVGGVKGVWRSTDEAVTWDKIADYGPLGLSPGCYSSDGDKDVFGTCYFNISGIGSAYGELKGDTTPPAAPTNLSATMAGPTQIDLDWDDNAEPDLDSYNVYRSTTAGGPYGQVASDVGSSAYSDSGLTCETAYYYVVTAVDTSQNESAYSNEASATTDTCDTTPPAAPTNLTATAVSESQIDLDWDDNTETDLDSYNVYRDTVQIATGVASSSYSDTGLSPSTQYCYTVTAVDTSSNESAESNQACATTQEGSTTMHVDSITVTVVSVNPAKDKARAEVVIVDNLGAAVQDATVSGTFSGDVTGSGSDATDANGLAVIESGTANGITSVTFCVDDVTHATLTYDSTSNVETCDSNDGGDTTPPAAPTNLTATAVSPSQIDLDWDDNTEPDLDSYNVYRDTVQIATDVTSSSYSDTGLAASTQYCYTVTAVDTSANESAESNQPCATTQEPDTTPPAAPTNLTATAVSASQIDLDWDDNTE
ncbi:MAG: hypothetical protein R6V05_10795, partial [Candidatus Brocadiia bacterium]